MADAEQTEIWPVEDIPGPARLFYRVHIGQLPDKQLHPGVFREHGGAMSTDWEKYSTPEESQARAPQPTQNGIVALVAATIRSIEPLEVRHEPTPTNRSHSAVDGLGASDDMTSKVRRTKIRAKLFAHFHTWEIDPFSQ